MKYYVLSNISGLEPSIIECATIEIAKQRYREVITYASDVRIARDLRVTIEIIEDQEVEIRQ